jgi:hypothetical protein
MKLRIKGDSIRLRLTRREVEQLNSEGVVEAAVHFGGTTPPLVYRVKTSHDSAVSTAFDGRQLTISIPFSVADDWISSEQVGIEAFQTIDENQSLRILVEKDFACLTKREGEDESDAYPHPATAAFC